MLSVVSAWVLLIIAFFAAVAYLRGAFAALRQARAREIERMRAIEASSKAPIYISCRAETGERPRWRIYFVEPDGGACVALGTARHKDFAEAAAQAAALNGRPIRLRYHPTE